MRKKTKALPQQTETKVDVKSLKRHETKKSNAPAVMMAIVIVMAFLGVMFTFFPIGNPLESIGGTPGAGIFYAALISLGLLIAFIFLYAMRAVANDLLRSLAKEFGLDYDEITTEYKKMIFDEWDALCGKKKRRGDHIVPDDE